MKITVIIAILITLQISILAQNKTLAIVNGEKITQNDIKAMLASNPNVQYDKLPKDTKDKILSNVIDKRLLISVAKKSKLEKTKQYKQALKIFKEGLIFNVWLEKKSKKIKVSNSEIKKYYKNNLDDYKIEQKAHARHILLKEKKQAINIIKKLKSAKNVKKEFIKLAKEKSTGPSGANGGDLGWFNSKQMVAPFSKATFALKKHSFTKTPIKTQFGYHIIYLEDKTKAKRKKLSDVKQEIIAKLQSTKLRKEIDKLLAKLRKKAKVKIL